MQLNVLQHMVDVYQVELKGMRLMAVDATEATEAAKVRTLLGNQVLGMLGEVLAQGLQRLLHAVTFPGMT